MNIILKSMLMLLLLNLSLLAQGFNEFLDGAVKKSPYLHSSMLDINQAEQEGEILNRYQNPSLEMEASRFSPNGAKNENGYRTSISQPIRLWGISDDKKSLARAISKNAKTLYTKKRARFIRDISLLYTEYASQKMFLLLADEESDIAKKIYKISKIRYENGTISRGKTLQAKIAYEMIMVQKDNRLISMNKRYYELLKYAGINKQIALDENYLFKIKGAKKDENPDIAYLSANKNRADFEAKVNSHKIEWMNLYAEYENEPDQDIYRFGVSIPLAIFNTKSQERELATLEAKKSQLLIDNEKKRLNIEQIRLQKERASLLKVKARYENLLKSELELLAMFEEGYKIANTKLLELQDIKNRVIESKKHLIEIKTALNKNAIVTNYMRGDYNE